MATTINCVLLVDYDSLHRSLQRRGAELGDALAVRAGIWLEGIERGDLVSPLDRDVRRRLQQKRVYSDMRTLGRNRGWMTAHAFQVVETPVPGGRMRGAAEIQMVLDALEALDGRGEEIIILSADTELTPLIRRLRAKQRRVVMYATEQAGADYRGVADGTIEEAMLVDLLSRPAAQAIPEQPQGNIPRPPRMQPIRSGTPVVARPQPAPSPPPPPPQPQAQPQQAQPRGGQRRGQQAQPTPPPPPPQQQPARAPIDRDALAALVRRVHQATNVPLFSPKGFADLFRLLVEEVAARGYKFQATSDNVAAEMNRLGRNVTKRQVGFIIKGLALRGHVFGPEDEPDVLARSFFEQVLYLTDTAKLNLSDDEKDLMAAWVIGQRQDEPAAAPPPPPVQESGNQRRPSPRPQAQPQAAQRQAPQRAEPRYEAEPPAQPQPQRQSPPQRAPEPRYEAEPPQPQRPPAQRSPEPRYEPEPPSRANRPPEPPQRSGRPQSQPAARPQPAPPPPEPIFDAEFESDPVFEAVAAPAEAALDDSIMAAIADAVDVLVDNWGDPPQPEEPPPPPSPPHDGDEIGDEIQRILSSYSRGR